MSILPLHIKSRPPASVPTKKGGRGGEEGCFSPRLRSHAGIPEGDGAQLEHILNSAYHVDSWQESVTGKAGLFRQVASTQ